MLRWKFGVIVYLALVELSRCDSNGSPNIETEEVLVGSLATSTVTENQCWENNTWYITVKPDPAKNLTGKPYVHGQRGETSCTGFLVRTDDGNPAYRFVLDIEKQDCKLERGAHGHNGTYSVRLIVPKRSDGIEVREDHIMIISCREPRPFYHYNETVPALDPIFTDLNPNKTADKEVTPPTVLVEVLRDGTGILEGAVAFLGETLTMAVTVIDPNGVYTHVKVHDVWATQQNNPMDDTRLELINDGCVVTMEDRIFDNFVRFDNRTDRVTADFRAFRFAKDANNDVFFWLIVTTCSYQDTTTCEMCTSRRKRDTQLIPIKRSFGGATLSGLASFNLEVRSPMEMPDKTKTGLQPSDRDVIAMTRDVCLSMTQAAVVIFLSVLIIVVTATIAAVLFFKMKAALKQAAGYAVMDTTVLSVKSDC